MRTNIVIDVSPSIPCILQDSGSQVTGENVVCQPYCRIIISAKRRELQNLFLARR